MKRLLVEQRPVASDAPTGSLLFVRHDWVSTWVDRYHTHWCEDRELSASRAITAEGRLIWLVGHPDHRRPYHARSPTSAEAFEEARSAWRRRAQMRERRTEIRQIVRELRCLEVRHDVTVNDAYASPLCEEGVDGFMRTLRIDRFHRFPGWLVAWLFLLDRQVGYVLYEARKRHEAEGSLKGRSVCVEGDR